MASAWGIVTRGAIARVGFQGLRAAMAQDVRICHRGGMTATQRGLMLLARQGQQHVRGGGGTDAGAVVATRSTCDIRGSLRATGSLVNGGLVAVRETSCIWTKYLFKYCSYAMTGGFAALATGAALSICAPPLSFLTSPFLVVGAGAMLTSLPAGLCALCVATGGSLGALPLVVHHINNILDACLSWMPFRGRLLIMLIGMFLGAGGGTAILLKYNHEEATLPLGQSEDTCVVTDSGQVDWSAMMCSGSLHRWSQWPPGWRRCQGEIIPRLLLLGPGKKEGEGKDSADRHAVDLAFSGGPTLTAVPLKGAELQRGTQLTENAAGKIPLHEAKLQEHSRSLIVKTMAGDVEYLKFGSSDEADQWLAALREAAGVSTNAASGATAKELKPQASKRRVFEVTYPETWDGEGHEFRLVSLAKNHHEYRTVEKLCLTQQLKNRNSYVKGKIQVRKISRVQSPHVWEQYILRRAIIASENGGKPDERLLWHGTNAASIIMRTGLDPRVCNLDGMFGGGVYFADKSTKSVRYTSATAKGKWGQMLLCRVSLGRQLVKYSAERGLRRVPQPSPVWPSQFGNWLRGDSYHSIFASANGSNLLMNEYIVYHSNQGYPEYLVDFELV